MMELECSGIRFVSERAILHRFSGIIDASREVLNRVVSAHHDILAERYGDYVDEAIKSISPADIPRASVAVSEAALSAMRTRMENANAAQILAEQKARLGGKEREELELLRAKERDRLNRAKHRRRSDENKK